jgi:hypothetical protein
MKAVDLCLAEKMTSIIDVKAAEAAAMQQIVNINIYMMNF